MALPSLSILEIICVYLCLSAWHLRLTGSIKYLCNSSCELMYRYIWASISPIAQILDDRIVLKLCWSLRAGIDTGRSVKIDVSQRSMFIVFDDSPSLRPSS